MVATVIGHDKAFWFVTMISNPLKFRSRSNLYKEFRRHILKDLNSNLLTVELMQGETESHVTKQFEPEDHIFPNPVNTLVHVCRKDNEIVVQIRADSVLWHKENMLNVGFTYLPSTCKYVAWVDADLQFINKNIVADTVHQLQFYKVVQMFQNCCDLGSTGEVIQIHSGFGYCYRKGFSPPWIKNPLKPSEGQHSHSYDYYCPEEHRHHSKSKEQGFIPHTKFHPGYAWAARLETINSLGGLFDTAILGSGDHHMSLCMIGKGEDSIPKNIHPNYVATIQKYQELCNRYVQKRLGYVNGTCMHFYHGNKKHRRYISRWQILIRNNYDPLKDIIKNLHGAYEFVKPESTLAHEILDYFKSRNEDTIVDEDEDDEEN